MRAASAAAPPSRVEVVQLLSERAPDLRRLGVKRLALFGSVLHDAARPGSDVDLLVEFQPGRKTYDNFIGVASFLEDLLGVPVDLVTAEGLSPFIGPRILAELEDVSLAG